VRDKIHVGDVIIAVDREDVSKLKGVHGPTSPKNKSKNVRRTITIMKHRFFASNDDFVGRLQASLGREQKSVSLNEKLFSALSIRAAKPFQH